MSTTPWFCDVLCMEIPYLKILFCDIADMVVSFQSITTPRKNQREAVSDKIVFVRNVHVIMERKGSRARNFTLSMNLPLGKICIENRENREINKT